MESRQRSLIYRGVYLPDARFNAFADGVMVNMVAEMKRKEMDPLYFRVFQRGIIEHVPLSSSTPPSTSTSSSFTTTTTSTTTSSRRGRQRGEAIGGGVIRGLTSVRRFGNAEVQVAGNTTLVRTHFVFGPLYLELLFTTEMGVRAVNSTLGALAAHAVAHVNQTDPSFVDFIIDSPLYDYMPYYGNRTGAQQATAENLVGHLFSSSSFVTQMLKGSFWVASYDKIVPQFGADANYYNVLNPAPYEIQLVGSKSERYKRLSLSAVTRLFKPTGRLERRMRGAFTRARKRRIPDVTKRRKGGRRRNGGGGGGGGDGGGVTPELP